jgi:hypothetical protein
MNMRLTLILAVAIFGAGYYTAIKMQPPKEIEKVVDNVVTKIRTVTTPGQTITETVVVEKKVQEAVKPLPVPKKDYGIGGGLSTEGYYGSISRRMIGDIWLEAAGNMKGTLNIGVRYEF